MNTTKKQTFVNLTAHYINVYSEDGENHLMEIEPSGKIARCVAASEKISEVEGIPLLRTTFGAVEDLPEPKEGIIYITSLLVRTAVSREDVASPGMLLRDSEGKPKGCKGLAVS